MIKMYKLLKGDAKEVVVYHGTDADNVSKIQHNGWDRSFNKRHAWGKVWSDLVVCFHGNTNTTARLVCYRVCISVQQLAGRVRVTFQSYRVDNAR